MTSKVKSEVKIKLTTKQGKVKWPEMLVCFQLITHKGGLYLKCCNISICIILTALCIHSVQSENKTSQAYLKIFKNIIEKLP